MFHLSRLSEKPKSNEYRTISRLSLLVKSSSQVPDRLKDDREQFLAKTKSARGGFVEGIKQCCLLSMATSLVSSQSHLTHRPFWRGDSVLHGGDDWTRNMFIVREAFEDDSCRSVCYERRRIRCRSMYHQYSISSPLEPDALQS